MSIIQVSSDQFKYRDGFGCAVAPIPCAPGVTTTPEDINSSARKSRVFSTRPSKSHIIGGAPRKFLGHKENS